MIIVETLMHVCRNWCACTAYLGTQGVSFCLSIGGHATLAVCVVILVTDTYIHVLLKSDILFTC